MPARLLGRLHDALLSDNADFWMLAVAAIAVVALSIAAITML